MGTAAARGGQQVFRGLGSADDIATTSSTGTSTTNTGSLGGGGTGSLFDSDAVTAANRQTRSSSTPQTNTGTSRFSFDEFVSDSRGQMQISRQQPRSRSQTPEINDDRVTSNLYQQSVDNQLRRQRRATDDSTFSGERNPFGENTLRSRAEADAEAIARRERQNPGALFDDADDVAGFGGGSFAGFGLGAGSLDGFLGSSVRGQETPATGQTLFEIGRGGSSQSGSAELNTGSGVGLGQGLGSSTASGTDEAAAQTFTLRGSSRTGSRSARPIPFGGQTSDQFADPTTANPTRGARPGGRPGTSSPRPRRPSFDGGDDKDDEELLFGTDVDSDLFDSGILSADEATEVFGDTPSFRV